VTFRYQTDVASKPALLASFDRIVIATGAEYRFGLGPMAAVLLNWGAGRWPGLVPLFSRDAVRDWFYYKARKATAERFTKLVKPGQVAVAIGDAVHPGKSKQAIAAAFEAALLGHRRMSRDATDPPQASHRPAVRES
jgi:hypothetical protein